MNEREHELNSEILDCLREDPGMSAAAIGKKVKLTETPVRERIRKLEESGVLTRAAVIDYDRVASYAMEAYVEVSFPGDADVHDSLETLLRNLGRRQIREAMTLVGDVDAMLRVRARNVIDLRKLVSEIRAQEGVTGTETRIVAGRWWHGGGLKRPEKPVASANGSG